MRQYENRSTIMTSNRPLEERGKLLVDVSTVGAILDRFLHQAQTIAITGRSYRLKDHATVAGKEDKNNKIKSKPNVTKSILPAQTLAWNGSSSGWNHIVSKITSLTTGFPR